MLPLAAKEEYNKELVRFHLQDQQLVSSSPNSTVYTASGVRWPVLEGLQLTQWDHCKPVRWLRYPTDSKEYKDNVQAVLVEADDATQKRQAEADTQGIADSEADDDDGEAVLNDMMYAALQRKAAALRQGLDILAAVRRAALGSTQTEHLRVSIKVSASRDRLGIS